MSSAPRYDAFVLHNVSTISNLESSLRWVTWFLPGRFKDAELASEALSTLVHVVSMYHDTLIAKIIQSNPKYRPLVPPSLHTRFTRAWSDRSDPYRWTARALELIRYTELVIEIGLRRKVSDANRRRGIILLEVIKAVFRLLLLRITRRPLLAHPLPERDLDATNPLPPSTSTSPTLAPSSPRVSPPATPDHLKNNRIPLPPHSLLSSASSEASVEDYLLSKSLTSTSVRPSLSLMKTLSSPQDWAAEVIHILRPLTYASLLFYSRHPGRPLVISILMQLLSRTLRRTPPTSGAIERAEYARRDGDIFWYLLRGSIWESYTRPKVEAVIDRTAQTPILGLVGAFAKDWIPLIDEYYYYTAP
ncbi:peroxisome membrane protein [Infundibulicybe gibba]|nr:peroxisome membrane protein [Infundibulicybe gibba]